MGQLRQFIIQLLPQPSGEKGEALQQTLHVRVPAALTEEGRQRRVALGKTLACLAQGAQFALVVVVDGHGRRPSRGGGRGYRARTRPRPSGLAAKLTRRRSPSPAMTASMAKARCRGSWWRGRAVTRTCCRRG